MFDLQGKVAIVTGSTRGIGRATAEHLARAGAKVVISSRKADMCEKVAGELAAEGLDVMAVPCHVAYKDQLHDLVDQTVAKWGRLDILVCNAATNPVYGPLSEMTDEAYDKIMNTNVRSTFWLCNKALPEIAKQEGGSVVLLSSIAGIRGNDVIGIYGVSKAAEAGLARHLAVEWGPKGVRINAVAPGLIETDFAKALLDNPDWRDRAEQRTPLRRIGQPEDIAGVVTFLASKASAFMTGQLIVADGGETIC